MSGFSEEEAISSRYDWAVHRYLEQQMTGAEALDLLIKTFDYAIAACDRRDTAKVEKGLTALEQGLDFEPSRELAASLASLYRHCRDLLARQEFDEISGFLGSLRDSWRVVKARREIAR